MYVTVCSSLSCYQCSSETDPECMEDFDNGNDKKFLKSTECDVNAAQYCVKTTGIFGGKIVLRLLMCQSINVKALTFWKNMGLMQYFNKTINLFAVLNGDFLVLSQSMINSVVPRL